MRNPENVLSSLTEKAKQDKYLFDRLYRNLYNSNFYLLAYQRIYAKEGNMTEGSDGKTIDGMGLERINNIIELIKTEKYQPKPAKRVYIPKKNGKQRPLGIPSFDDKLVQEVIRMILESIYEPKFSNKSHGFRPNRSCHTALKQVKNTFGGMNWFIEGDIKSFFDNINHNKMIEILKKSIKDEKFIRLIWKFLRAGYLENWRYNNTYSGTPQGGIISPILANIYLNEFDKFMENLKNEFDKGKIRKFNPEYKKYADARYRKVRKLIKNEYVDERYKAEAIQHITELNKLLENMPSKNPFDEGFKRLQYNRYADDFIIGIIGSKEDSINIKNRIKNYLELELQIELSEDKTKITNTKEFAKYLGYEIAIVKNRKTNKTVTGTNKKTGKYIILQMPHEAWVNKLKELKAINMISIQKDDWKGRCRARLLNLDDLEILEIYNAEIRGLYNYYRLASNVSVMNKFYYIMQQSLLKTLASKYNTTSGIIFRKYQIDGRFAVKYETKNGEKVRYLIEKTFIKQDTPSTDTNIDYHPNVMMFMSNNSLVKRLLANECEWCGEKEGKFEVHHVRKLKELRSTRSTWELNMIERNRKTMVLCEECHKKLHKGELG